jgi:hypothetical protein
LNCGGFFDLFFFVEYLGCHIDPLVKRLILSFDENSNQFDKKKIDEKTIDVAAIFKAKRKKTVNVDHNQQAEIKRNQQHPQEKTLIFSRTHNVFFDFTHDLACGRNKIEQSTAANAGQQHGQQRRRDQREQQ